MFAISLAKEKSRKFRDRYNITSLRACAIVASAERSIPKRVTLAGPGAGDYQYEMASEDVLELSDSSFEAEIINSELPALVDFWAVWCGPCKQVTTYVEALAEEYKGKIKVGKFNIDDNIGIPQKFGIRSIPTILVFKGGQVVGQIVGAQPKSKVEAELKKHM